VSTLVGIGNLAAGVITIALAVGIATGYLEIRRKP